MTRLEALIAKDRRPRPSNNLSALISGCVGIRLFATLLRPGNEESNWELSTYLKEIPYCATCSKPVFHTRVTSQAFVAWSRHDKKAETEFPPTVTTFISSLLSDMSGLRVFENRKRSSCHPKENNQAGKKKNECGGDGRVSQAKDVSDLESGKK